MLCDGNCKKCQISPHGLEWYTKDGLFLKEVKLAKVGDAVAQHVHARGHTTFLFSGAVRVTSDLGVEEFHKAPAAIFIPAGVSHKLEALADNTACYCIHNLQGDAEVPIVVGG